jgi:hypothetical protein
MVHLDARQEGIQRRGDRNVTRVLLILAVLLGLASSPAIAGPSNAVEKIAKVFGVIPACMQTGVIGNSHDDDVYIADSLAETHLLLEILKDENGTEEQLKEATVAQMKDLGYEKYCESGKPLMDRLINDLRKNSPNFIRMYREAAGVQ